MTRVTVPGDTSGWFDLEPVSALNPDHQDAYWELRDELVEAKRAALPPLANPNPAVVAARDERDVRLGRRDLTPLHGLVLTWVLDGSSYGIDTAALTAAAAEPDLAGRAAKLAAVASAERRRCTLPAWNKLVGALDDYHLALLGVVPKEDTDATTTPISATTSGEPA